MTLFSDDNHDISEKKQYRGKKKVIQERLDLTFSKLDPEEPVLLVCGHTALYKNISKYGYGWCRICGKRTAKMF